MKRAPGSGGWWAPLVSVFSGRRNEISWAMAGDEMRLAPDFCGCAAGAVGAAVGDISKVVSLDGMEGVMMWHEGMRLSCRRRSEIARSRETEEHIWCRRKARLCG